MEEGEADYIHIQVVQSEVVSIAKLLSRALPVKQLDSTDGGDVNMATVRRNGRKVDLRISSYRAEFYKRWAIHKNMFWIADHKVMDATIGAFLAKVASGVALEEGYEH